MIKVKNLFLPLALLGFIIAPATASDRGLSVVLPWDGEGRLAFNLKKDARVWLSYKEKVLKADFEAGGDDIVVFNFDAGGALDEDYIHDEFVLTTGDYNFDGFTDFAVVTSHGYAGVNVFNDIFLFDKNAGNFVRSLRGVCNIELDTAKRVLATNMKSGPRYYTAQYRFDGLKSWVSYEGVWFAEETEFNLRRSRDGKIISREVIDTSTEKGAPAIRKIGVKKARLHNRADDATQTKMYLVEGDKVRIMDFVETVSGDWVKIRYDGKRRIEKWLKMFDVNWNIAAQ